MTHIAIRPLARGDLPCVAHLVDANAMFPSEMLADMTAGYFAGDPSQRWIVAGRGGAVEGVAYTVPEPLTEGTWNTLCICVDPAAHGQGIGAALMRHIEDELRKQGARVLLVETSGTPAFERTRGFYDMLGYEREARIRDYYSAGDDKIVFRKALV
ncbi:GNAT family N-acetyltransferase [Erythrobacter oryzae]|uniref:GNAT family N-acetyltransferase n=1 Tax=Erythrobacter oryzae TaxID=3019556 RepID=UPI002552DF7C|nr:GNAT family N-acetyltransferase [Erythrobacter sp. COR-2]